MQGFLSDLAWLRDPGLASYAIRAAPVWFWRSDRPSILWANAAGAACFGATSPRAVAALKFSTGDPSAKQIARIGAGLLPRGLGRLELLRGFGEATGRPRLCACSRATVEDVTGILVVAQDASGRPMPLAARVRYFLAESKDRIAAFTPEGGLLASTPALDDQVECAAVSSLGADTLASAALSEGSALGDTRLGRARFVRLPCDEAAVLVASFDPVRASPPADFLIRGTSPAGKDAPIAADRTAPGGVVGPDEPLSPAPDRRVEPPPVAPGAPTQNPPFRFLWNMDPDGRFTLLSNDFAEAIGPKSTGALGRPWRDIAAEFGLDPDGKMAGAIASRATWSGMTVSLPLDDCAERLTVELSGLPVYDETRTFLGYRGFGVCSEVGLLQSLGRAPPQGLSGARRAGPYASRPASVVEEAALAAGQPSIAACDAERAERQPAGPAASGAPIDCAAPSERRRDGDGALLRAVLPQPDGRARDRPAPPAENVVPFPAAATEGKAHLAWAAPSQALSPADHNVFAEIARQLRVRLSEQPAELAEPAAPVDPVDFRESAELAEPAALVDPVDFRESAELAEGAELAAPAAHQEPAQVQQAAKLRNEEQAGDAARGFIGPDGRNDDPTAKPAHARQPLRLPSAASATSATSAASMDLEAFIDRLPLGVLIYRLDLPLYANRAFLEATGHAGIEAFAQAGGLDSLFVNASAGAPPPDRGFSQALTVRARNSETTSLAARLFCAPWKGEAAFALVLVQDTAAERETPPAGALRRAETRIRELRSILDAAFDGVIVLSPEGRIALANRSAETLFGYEANDIEGERFAALIAPESREYALSWLDRVRRERSVSADAEQNVMGRTRLGQCVPLAMRMGAASSGDQLFVFLRAVAPETASAPGAPAIDESRPDGGRGGAELAAAPFDLNSLVQACVKTMQAEANRQRIIIRMSLSRRLPPALADAASAQRIILCLVANAIKFARAGAQVIVSTGVTDRGDVALRVRNTGAEISRTEREAAQPLIETRNGPDLPLARSLTEANYGTFTLTSKATEGALVEVTFPASRLDPGGE